MRYAETTEVPIERSKAELESMLRRAGANRIGTMHEEGRAILIFELAERTYRLSIHLPTLEELQAKSSRKEGRGNKSKNGTWAERTLPQEERRLWRVLALLTKAKLTAIAEGSTTVEREFLADLMVKGGRTVGEIVAPELRAIYEGKNPPRLLLGMGER